MVKFQDCERSEAPVGPGLDGFDSDVTKLRTLQIHTLLESNFPMTNTGAQKVNFTNVINQLSLLR